jgi:hypothetical protein
MQLIELNPVQSVTITILADNMFDGLLPDQGVAKRPTLGPHIPRISTAIMEGGPDLRCSSSTTWFWSTCDTHCRGTNAPYPFRYGSNAKWTC